MHARELSRDCKKLASLVNNLLFIKPVAPRDVKVGGIVPWSYGHDAGAEFHVNRFVFDHDCRNRPLYPFKLYFLSIFIFFVARVIRMHDHVFVAEFGFGARRAYDKRPVFQIIKRRGFFNPINFVV